MRACRFLFRAAAVSLVGNSVALAAGDLRAGIATVDITPPVGYRMSGYFMERVSTGTKDPLFAKAVVFRQASEAAALVFCDLVGVPLEVSAAVRRQASQSTGIPAEHIAVAATHSHTGPLYFGALRKHFHERSIAQSGKDPHETIDYPRFLIDKLTGAIEDASSKMHPVELAAGHADENRLSFNRRFHMKDGSVRFNPGELNPNIVRAAGPIDPQVGIVSLRRPGETMPVAAIVAFALHLDTTGGTEYSADFPKFAEDRLRQAFGRRFSLLFGAGTCGDINHIDVTTRTRRSAAEIGSLLAETVALTMQNGTLPPTQEPSLAVRSARFDARLQSYSESEIALARKNMELVGGRELPFLEQVEAYKIMALELQKSKTLPLEVQVIRLDGNTAIVTLPGEVFVELGLAIKAASPFKTTILIELTNQALGYIPTRKATAEGSYETVNSIVEPGTGERLVEAAIALLRELE